MRQQHDYYRTSFLAALLSSPLSFSGTSIVVTILDDWVSQAGELKQVEVEEENAGTGAAD